MIGAASTASATAAGTQSARVISRPRFIERCAESDFPAESCAASMGKRAVEMAMPITPSGSCATLSA